MFGLKLLLASLAPFFDPRLYAITNAFCNQAKLDLLLAKHAIGTTVTRGATTADTLKIALFTSAASLDKTTTQWVNTGINEVANGNGYATGGVALTLAATYPKLTGDVACVDFDDASWPTSTITARGAMIYNDTHASDASIAILDFGADKSSSNGTFTVQFPTANGTTDIIRIG